MTPSFVGHFGDARCATADALGALRRTHFTAVCEMTPFFVGHFGDARCATPDALGALRRTFTAEGAAL